MEIENGRLFPENDYFFLSSITPVDRTDHTEYLLNVEPVYAVYYSVDSGIGIPVETAALILDDGSSGQGQIRWSAIDPYNPSLPEEQNITFCGSVTLPDNITNTTQIDTMINTTVTIYGSKASTYTLTYDLNGGTGDIPEPSSYKAGDRIILCSSVSKAQAAPRTPTDNNSGMTPFLFSFRISIISVFMAMPSSFRHAVFPFKNPVDLMFDQLEEKDPDQKARDSPPAPHYSSINPAFPNRNGKTIK